MEKNFTNSMVLMLKILIVVIISRLALCFAGYIGMNTFPMYDSAENLGFQSGSTVISEDIRKIKLEDFNKFDSGFYFQIADNGYPKVNMSQSTSATSISFFPLYPLLIRTMKLFNISNSNLINSLILSNVLLVLALFYIYRICEERGFHKKEIYFVLALILCYPYSIFYSVPYTESLFLFLSAATIYYSIKGDYLKALIFAGLSATTRFPGFLNVAYVFFMLLSEETFKTDTVKQIKKIIAYMIVSVIPITIYFSYMKYLTGDFLAPLHDVGNWGRKLSIPFKSYVDYLLNPYFFYSGGWNNGLISFVIATAILLIFIYYAVVNCKKITSKELILFIYGFLIITIPFSNTGSGLVSIPRYLMVSIPLYLYIVELYRKREFIFISYLFLFTALSAIVTIGYFNGYYFVV
ncbi:MAG: mannosyltransferase family protein [Clostridium sp.]|nr:mannosyltransferase family protein [Clostridium sp.]